MKNFENRIKEELSKARSMEGLDSEVLWKAITASDNKRKKRRFGIYWFFFVASMILTFMFLGVTNRWSESGLNSQENNVLNSNKENNLKSIENSQWFQKQSGNMNGVIDSIVSSYNQEATWMPKENKESLILNNDQRKRLHLTENSERSSGPSWPVSRPDSMEYRYRCSLIEEDRILAPCSPSKFLTASLIQPKFNEQIVKQDVQRRLKFHTSHCYAGPLWSQQTYINGDKSFTDSLNADLTPESGYLVGGMFELKRLAMGAILLGLEYSSWKDRFDKVMISDTLLIINQQEVLGKNIRTIKHHNSLSILTFPIHWAMYKNISRVRLGIQLGVSYSLILQQEGRILIDDTSVFNYSQNQKRYANFFSFRIVPSLGYGLNEKLLLNFSCYSSIQQHKKMAINGLRSNSFTIAPTVSLVFNY